MKRYRDAYQVANVTSGIGTLIKLVGFLGGLLLIAAPFASASFGFMNVDPPIFVAACILGVVVILVFFFFGILVSAQGQILRASLDNAVHGSPFLTDEQRFQIM